VGKGQTECRLRGHGQGTSKQRNTTRTYCTCKPNLRLSRAKSYEEGPKEGEERGRTRGLGGGIYGQGNCVASQIQLQEDWIDTGVQTNGTDSSTQMTPITVDAVTQTAAPVTWRRQQTPPAHSTRTLSRSKQQAKLPKRRHSLSAHSSPISHPGPPRSTTTSQSATATKLAATTSEMTTLHLAQTTATTSKTANQAVHNAQRRRGSKNGVARGRANVFLETRRRFDGTTVQEAAFYTQSLILRIPFRAPNHNPMLTRHHRRIH
jgi:hypothetical protein